MVHVGRMVGRGGCQGEYCKGGGVHVYIAGQGRGGMGG